MTTLYGQRSTALVLVCLWAPLGCHDSRLPAESSSKGAAVESAPVATPTAVGTSVESEQADTAPRNPRTAGGLRPIAPDGIRDTTFDDVKFAMKKEERFERRMLTPEIEQLDGQRIRIRGYILPTFRQTGLTQFVLVRDNMECCFGPGAALFDAILVEMNAGVSTDFSIRPVAVEGVFSLRELVGPDGKHLAVYHLQGEAVR